MIDYTKIYGGEGPDLYILRTSPFYIGVGPACHVGPTPNRPFDESARTSGISRKEASPHGN